MQENTFHTACLVNDWYVVHCKVGKEYLVNAVLGSRFRLNTYLPEEKVRQGKEIRLRPFFPGYLFIQANFEKIKISDINFCTGVKYIVACNGKPQPISQAIVLEIRERLERLNASGRVDSHQFQPGEQVRVGSGLLEGLDAVFISSAKPNERVWILLNFLGRLTKVQIETTALESLKKPSEALKQRYTRGNGRKINLVSKSSQQEGERSS